MDLLEKTLPKLILLGIFGIILYFFLFSNNIVRVFAGYGYTDETTSVSCSQCEETDPSGNPDNFHGDVPPGGLTDHNPPGDYWDDNCGCMVGWEPDDDDDGDDEGGDDDDDDDDDTVPPPQNQCSMTLSDLTITTGLNGTMYASVNTQGGTTQTVSFSSEDPSIASIASTNPPYATIHGVSSGGSQRTTTINATATVEHTYQYACTQEVCGADTCTPQPPVCDQNGQNCVPQPPICTPNCHDEPATCTGTYNSNCSDSATVTVKVPKAWFQTQDADVWARGSLSSIIPESYDGNNCDGKYFSCIGTGGFPGVIAYNGSIELAGGSVSSKNWQANSGYGADTPYNYSWFEQKIPTNAVITPISSANVNNGDFNSASVSSDGYAWMKRSGDLTIDSDVNVNNKKVVLFVSGSLTIKGQVKLNPGSGFFMAVTGGDIAIDKDVSHPNQPELEGIYFANGNISTGTGGTKEDDQLHIRGSIAANGSINLQRDGGDINQNVPSEYIEFAPDLIFTYPPSLGLQSFIWKEVAP